MRSFKKFILEIIFKPETHDRDIEVVNDPG